MVSARRIARSPITWTVAVLLVAALGAGLAVFQPWRLFIDTTVQEAAPSAATAPGPDDAAQQPRAIAKGTFVSHEHATAGTVVVLRLPDGNTVLRLENLDTSDGPDLHVWLTDAPVREGRDGWFVFDDGAHTDLGELKGNQGNQNYAVPADADLTQLTSVAIWCDRFNVSFGAAELRPV
ncbi:DM13 domain-containing protein [Nocardia abscessus]|uniref:DM13 domain-containing protein n=1 Tax=Nocardia abscessus TaxID=120957 RepID=UPI0002F96648|nr:DM13 domain-containing protein [Nocardia abscessus]MCC3332498.1 DM13 domain-containing protein [Nocardia abscessus]